jgi:two-component system nitrate/nitrite sensor histidine kinase NarX
MEVRDDGVGFDTTAPPPEGHHGMRNIASRARSIGANLRVESAPGKGTRVALEFTPRAG